MPKSELKLGEIIGHRAWRLFPNTGMLHSMFFDIQWLPGTPMDGKPDIQNCGVYAWKEPRFNESYISDLACASIIIIGGTVELYGLIDEHEYGYRAEHAMIASLDFAAYRYLDPARRTRPNQYWAPGLDMNPAHYTLAPLRATYLGAK